MITAATIAENRFGPPVLVDGLRVYSEGEDANGHEFATIVTLDGKRDAGLWLKWPTHRGGIVAHRCDKGDDALLDAELRDVVAACGREFEAVTIIPCGGAKLPHRAAARDLYTGALFRSALAAAKALRDRVLVLSAMHGLVELGQRLDPYDVTIGDPRSITVSELREQLGLLVDHPDRVTALLPIRYDTLLTAAVGQPVRNPLRGSRGIGEQRGRLSQIARDGALA